MTDPGDPRPPRDVDAVHAHLVEQRLGGECVYDGALLHVRRDRVRLPDGAEATREYVVHPGAVLVVPVTDDGAFVVVRQYRYPLNRVMLEFPAGKLDPGESPLVTAKRELEEETGYVASRWTPLGRVYSIVSYSTEFIELFLAEGLSHVGAALDDGEFLEVGTIGHDAMLDALDRGELTDAKSVAALMFLERRRGAGR